MTEFLNGILGQEEAKLRYESGRVVIIKPGRFVRCSVTATAIPLQALTYWNVERQEAYASPEASLKRHLARLSE